MAALPITPGAAAHALRRLEYLRRQLLLSEMTKSLITARGDAVVKYMHPRAPASSLPQADRLTHRSGRLGRSTKVNPPRFVGDNLVGGLITGGATAPYGPIQELGGKTKAHIIRPLRGEFLAWPGIGAGGPSFIKGRRGPRKGLRVSFIFAREVHHPGSNIPARPRLRPALEDALPQLLANLTAVYRKAAADVGLG